MSKGALRFSWHGDRCVKGNHINAPKEDAQTEQVSTPSVEQDVEETPPVVQTTRTLNKKQLREVIMTRETYDKAMEILEKLSLTVDNAISKLAELEKEEIK